MSRMGTEISRLRQEIGMSQKQLAKQIGASESYIIEIENGKRVVSDDIARKISKALRKEINKVDIFEEEIINTKPAPENVARIVQKPVQQVWNDALAGILMNVPVYEYKLEKVLFTRPLPIISNKVEGYAKDKVIYLVIDNNEMSGFRLLKGDMAFGHLTTDFEKDGIYILKHKGSQFIRQLKKLDGEKLLMLHNDGRLSTETILKKEVEILAKLTRVELNL